MSRADVLAAAYRMFAAGIYEQQADGVWKPVAWSRHRSERAAENAARRYRRKIAGQQTGGTLSWSAWWARLDGGDLVSVVRVGGR